MNQPEPIKVYTQEFVCPWGVKTTYFYDKNKFPNGPIKVEIEYPKTWKSDSEELDERQKDMPITKRKYYHPETGDLVGYSTYMKFVNENKAPHPDNMD
jgi:hypothetical protein